MDLFETVAQRFAGMLGRKQDALPAWPAVLGDIFGTVRGSQRKYVLVRWPETSPLAVEVYNGDLIPLVAGTHIMIGYTPDRPRLLRTLSIIDQRTDNADYGLAGPHADSHAYLAHDQVYIAQRQITDLRVYPAGGLNVTIQTGLIDRGGVPRLIPDTTISLAAYVPGSGARYALICLDATGGIVVTPGVVRASSAVLAVADIPARPPGYFALAAVRLYSGQVEVRENRSVVDILDRRWPQDVGDSSNAVTARKNSGAPIGPRGRFNFIEGPNVSISLADDATDNEFDLTISAPDVGSTTPPALAAEPQWVVDGPLAVADEAGGVYAVKQPISITSVWMYAQTTGTSGSTIVDVDRSIDGVTWVTLFTTQANRPTLAFDDADHQAMGTPDVTRVDPGALLRMNIESVAIGARGLSVMLRGSVATGLSIDYLPILGCG